LVIRVTVSVRSLPRLGFVVVPLLVASCSNEHDPCSDPCAYTRAWFDGTADTCSLPDPAIPLGAHSFELASFRLTADDGANLDGVNNAPRGGTGGGSGKTIAGCGQVDLPFGKDAEFADAVAELAPTFGGFEMFAPIAAATSESVHLEYVLERRRSPADATRGCVLSDLRIDGSDVPTWTDAPVYAQSGSHAIGTSMTFELHPTIDPSACDGPCVDASLVVRVDRPIVELRFDETYSHVVAGSFIAGVVFFEEESDVDPARNAAGFRAELERFATAAHLTAIARTELVSRFESRRDLHVDLEGSIDGCTSPNGSVTTTNRNAVSIAIAIASPP